MSESLAIEPDRKPIIPRGFRPTSKQPRHGQRVIVILADKSVDIVEFGPVASPDPALLHVVAFHRNGVPVAVLGWRCIPRNWKA